MQLWKKQLSLIFIYLFITSGCGGIQHEASGQLLVRNAKLVTTTKTSAAKEIQLELSLDCRLSKPMQEALDHGIPLTLNIELTRGVLLAPPIAQHIELRYFPLTRRYQLHEVENNTVRSFPASAYLINALTALHLPLPTTFAIPQEGTKLALHVVVDRAALPGALRLPAMFERAWRLSAPEYTWIAGAG